MEVSQIMYRNISGTSQSERAMKFACSDTVPCKNIILHDINLEKKDGTAQTYCHSATGIGYGYIQPSAECLNSSDKDFVIEQSQEVEPEKPRRENLIHSEL